MSVLSGGVLARTLRVSSPAIPVVLGHPALEPVRLSGQEGVNRLFTYELLLKTPDSLNLGASGAADFDLDAFIGREIQCRIELDGSGSFLPGAVGASVDHVGAGVRVINALITEASLWGEEGRHVQYKLALRPWLNLATLSSDCRIFQNQSVIEILDSLLADYAFPVDKRLIESYPYARGRIRFNRHTRKVYVLRPRWCGGNAVLDWDRLRAIVDMDGYDLLTRKNIASGKKLPYYALILYHPPFDPNDSSAKGEDALFVGPSLASGDSASPLWEYIRRYMEDGPGQNGIPAFASLQGSTYCGIPSSRQRELEDPFASGGFFYRLSVDTCSWPKFPKEWQSDSGLGEPEERPVQTGAVMTALVYRTQGRLSAADEIEFLTHWGTPEALAKAKAAQGCSH